MRLAEQIVRARLRRAVLDGAAGKGGAFLILALLAGDHGDVIQRVGVSRVVAQHVGIAVHGQRELPLAVVEEALLQQRRGARGCVHAVVLSSQAGNAKSLTKPALSWYGFCSQYPTIIA